MVKTALKLDFAPIDDAADTTSFDCGNASLNTFIQKYALTNHKRRIGFTILSYLVGEKRKKIVGFYAVAPAQVSKEELPTKISRSLPRYPLPAFRISRLAVGSTWQNQGVGTDIFVHALIKCNQLAKDGGGYLVIVDAKSSSLTRFYEKFGFLPFSSNGLSLFLPIKTIESAYAM